MRPVSGPGKPATHRAAMDHYEPLVLKVMRLRRPHVEGPRAMPLSGGPDHPKLVLPMSLTQSLVGEPFTGYLYLANQSTLILSNVILRVELQIGAAKFVLFSNAASPIRVIEPGDFFDTDVEHELRDAGTYVLTCNVSYNLPGISEPGIFKRSYRFPTLQPFAVSHRVAQLDRQLLVECVVENATAGSIYLTNWRLDCTDGFEATLVDAAAGAAGANGRPGDEGARLLKPRGAHALVFRVAPRSETIDVAYVRQLDLLGSLALGWHVPEGPSGCVEGHQLRVRPCNTAPLDLRVVACPREVSVEAPFQVEVEVVNRANRQVEPSVVFDIRLMGAVRVHGATQQPVGRLEPYCTARVPLDFLVIVPGMHALQGVSLFDEVSKTRSDFGVLCDILAF